jgi:hypothetical protein
VLTLTMDETLLRFALFCTNDSSLAFEANDAADARGVNAWSSEGASALDGGEGVTARTVDLSGEE